MMEISIKQFEKNVFTKFTKVKEKQILDNYAKKENSEINSNKLLK